MFPARLRRLLLFRTVCLNPIAKNSNTSECLVAFGSNQGDSPLILKDSVDRLAQVSEIHVEAVSQPLITKPVGGPAGQDSYLNAAILLKTTLVPTQLHQQLVRIETELGRQRRKRWGARTVDLDLLIYGSVELESETLTIPHPRMTFRKFVLNPAVEIAKDLIHPTSGLSIGELVECLSNSQNVVLFAAKLGESKYETVIQSSMPDGWQLSTVFETEEADGLECDFDEKAVKAKLVCYVSTGEALSRITKKARSFAGPTLRLPPDPEKCKVEIEAAIEAMS